VPRRLSPVFRDQQDLSAGGDLAQEIKAALAASQFLVVLCSPTAAKSRWTNQEIESFKRTRPEGCVLAAVAAGEPFASDLPGHEDEECFPPALRFKYDRRGHQTTKRAEPLAADFREDGEGRRLAFLKLVAGMLGVGLDELVQRETTRRQRRLAYLAAASIAGMAVTSTLAVTAIQARNEAREQRREAEGLVEFMVGDLRAKLEPIGKLDALDGVGSRVLAYYKRQDATKLPDDALLQRSQALNLMAQVAYQRGNLDQSEALYRQALAGTAEAVRRSPNDSRRLFEHAQNVFWLGEIARFGGRADEAVAEYGEYKRLADRLVALEPDNIRWRMEGFYGVENMGISLRNERRFPEAARQFESALQPIQNLAALDSGNLSYQKELATVLAWLADTQRDLGNLDAAIALRQRQVSVLEKASSAKADVQLRTQLIPAHMGLGILLGWRGQTNGGIQQLRTAIGIDDGLIAVEPGNEVWKAYGANARLFLAGILLQTGARDEAAQLAETGCALIGRHSGSAPASSTQTNCLSTQARVALAFGDSQKALQFAQQGLALAQSEKSGDSFRDHFTVAGAYRLLGDAQRAAGDPAKAAASWANALAMIPSNVSEKPPELDEHALILERVGRAGEAIRLVSHLNAMGYRRQT
jgi:tetratricopeptide (TPR) repeat protein